MLHATPLSLLQPPITRSSAIPGAAAAGRWLMSGLHTFLMRPLTFSTIGTIHQWTAVRQHILMLLAHALERPADSHIHARDRIALCSGLFSSLPPCFLSLTQIHRFTRSAERYKEVEEC